MNGIWAGEGRTPFWWREQKGPIGGKKGPSGRSITFHLKAEKTPKHQSTRDPEQAGRGNITPERCGITQKSLGGGMQSSTEKKQLSEGESGLWGAPSDLCEMELKTNSNESRKEGVKVGPKSPFLTF